MRWMTGSIAALAGTLGMMAGAVAMPENNSTLAPLTLDMPDVPQHYASVMIAQANQTQNASTNKERAIGICEGVYNPIGKTYPDFLSPEDMAAAYFSLYEKRSVDTPPLSNVDLVEQPKHGKVIYSKMVDGLSHPAYIPDLNYEGDEKFVFKVSVDGATVRVVYLLKVTRMFTDSEGVHDYLCKDTGTQWKIAQPNVPVDNIAMQSLLAKGATH